MEHENEKVIREKIFRAELTPVGWNKEEVWASINKGESQSSKRFLIYYAAATIILAGALIFYSVLSTQRTEMELRIKSIELSLSRSNQPAGNVKQAENCLEEPTTEQTKELVAWTRGNSKTTNSISQTTVIEFQQQNDSTRINTPLSGNTRPQETESKMVETVVAKTPIKIDPIIGIHLPDEENAIVKKEKRLHFYWISPQERKQVQESEGQLFILARINARQKI